MGFKNYFHGENFIDENIRMFNGKECTPWFPRADPEFSPG